MSYWRFSETVRQTIAEFEDAIDNRFRDKFAVLLRNQYNYYVENYQDQYEVTEEISDMIKIVKNYRYKSAFEMGIDDLMAEQSKPKRQRDYERAEKRHTHAEQFATAAAAGYVGLKILKSIFK